MAERAEGARRAGVPLVRGDWRIEFAPPARPIDRAVGPSEARVVPLESEPSAARPRRPDPAGPWEPRDARPDLVEPMSRTPPSSPGDDLASFPKALLSREPDLVERLTTARPARPLRRVPGRETFATDDVEGLPPGWVVKRFGRGPLREALRERLRSGAVRSPARREFENLVALTRLGLPVPAPLFVAEAPGRAPTRSLVAMTLVPHSLTLRDFLAAHDPAPVANALLSLVVRLHAAGWYHRDLYLQHFVLPDLDRPDQLVLLDLGRCRRDAAPRRRWFEKDLAALLHSCPSCVPRRARLRFLLSYLRGRGLGAGRSTAPEARGWARAIGRRRARMASHRPRFGEEQEGAR